MEQEFFDINNFNIHQNKFNSMLTKIQKLMVKIGNDPSNKVNGNLNQLLRVIIFNQLEFEYNYPKSDSLVMLQARYNMSFRDAQNFSMSRYMFFKINFISILYFTLEQYADNLLINDKLIDKLTERNFRNKFRLLLSESKVSEFKKNEEIMTVFKFLRSTFHKGGIYHGENKKYNFGSIEFEFIENQSPGVTTESLLFLIENICQIIIEITESKRFLKFFKSDKI